MHILFLWRALTNIIVLEHFISNNNFSLTSVLPNIDGATPTCIWLFSILYCQTFWVILNGVAFCKALIARFYLLSNLKI